MSHYDMLRVQISKLNALLNDIDYHQAREEMNNIQKYFDQHLLSAQTHEKKTANRELHDLNKKIEKKKPKKKFNLIRKNKDIPKPVEEMNQTENSTQIEVEQSIANIENKTGVTMTYDASNEDQDLVLRNLDGCSITITGNCSSIFIENFKNSQLVMENCIFGAAMVRNSISD